MPGLENIESQPIQTIITTNVGLYKSKHAKPGGNTAVIQPNHAKIISRPIIENTAPVSDKYDFEDKMYNTDNVTDLNIGMKQDVHRVGSLDAEVLRKLFHNAKYFVVKSNNHQNVLIAKKLNVWATPPANQKRFDYAFRTHPNVFLIFSVRESGLFQGFARIRAPADHSHPKVEWSLPPTIDPQVFSGIIKLDWITRINLPFTTCNDLRNPYNDNKEVKISRDGQEIEAGVGEKLCRLFQTESTVDIPKVLNDIGIDEVIKKYASSKSNSIDHNDTSSKEYSLAKSRSRQSKDYTKRSSYSSHNNNNNHHSKYHDDYKNSKKYLSDKNLLPNTFLQKLFQLSQLSYEEYVAAVSKNRKTNIFSNINFINPLLFNNPINKPGKNET